MKSDNSCILLVEDDLSLRDSLCHFLNDHGYRTITATDIRQGWDLLRKDSPRLCLLDLNLPDGSGIDLLKRVAEHGLGTRIIVMTAFDLQPVRPKGLEPNLAGWLTKPVQPSDLLKLVTKTLQAP
jgi:DNA-binding response OmpR family regulator